MNQASEILVSLQQSGRMHPEGLHLDLEGQAQEEVRVISDYEANLLEREYIWQLKAAGFRKVRSPRGSEAEPEPKRVGRVPARPPQSSIPPPRLSSPYRQRWFGIWKLHHPDPACRQFRVRQVRPDRARRQACLACLEVRMNL
jgi:hypothetical protein